MPDLSLVLDGARASPTQQKLYLEHLSLGRLDVTASFLPAPWDAAASQGALQFTPGARFACSCFGTSPSRCRNPVPAATPEGVLAALGACAPFRAGQEHCDSR